MSYAALSLQQTPPISVPIRFMLTAPFFAVLAGFVLFMEPESLASRWTPQVLAVTHLLTLGFISMVMIGALQQLLPVLVGVQLRSSEWVSKATHLGLTIGTLGLSAAFLLGYSTILFASAILLTLTFLALSVLLLERVFSTQSSVQVTLGIKLALASFLITVVLGLYFTAGYALPSVPFPRAYTDTHVGWGLVGWICILIATISYQVVPMFQITPKYPIWIINTLAPSLFGMMFLLASLQFLLPDAAPGWRLLLGTLIGLVLVVYGVTTLRLQAARKRKLPDVTLRYWRTGMVCLLASVSLWSIGALWHPLSNQLDMVLAMFMLPGFVMSLITGMLYKIVPFLVWLHLTNQIDMSQRWQKRIPNMKQIISDKRSGQQFVAHLIALSMLLLAPLLPPLFTRMAMLAFMVSNLMLAWNLISGVRVYGRVLRMMDDESP